MIESVGLFEAKTHLSELVERARSGERITITKRGDPVAMLVPVDKGESMKVAEAARRLRKIRDSVSLDGVSIRELRDEGRRR